MQPERGQVDAQIDVAQDLTIQGVVTAGATVHAGATLAIRGAATGHFVVEEGGRLTIHGAFKGTIENSGTVMLAGVVTDGLPTTGQVAVAIGTVIGIDPPMALLGDGSLEIVSEDRTIRLNATSSEGYLLYDADQGKFVQTLPED